ncbi:DUF3618 domain-containing protein [Arenibacterium halophilum]|uniref:DUF3618 domain-containing protein n=2 Tax=Arenibacterium halophilum TaxID=2583821 RepID=A0ABY2WXZ8_9RHOB|nr:DUF3618 domain-containing protein [Arenibacterium halophilum]
MHMLLQETGTMSDHRSPDEIERDIERERAELRDTVGALQNRFSPDHIMREIGRGLTDHGSDIGNAITSSVKRNPVALALTGIGLAWLMSGKSWDDTPGVETARKALPSPRRTDPVATSGVSGYTTRREPGGASRDIHAEPMPRDIHPAHGAGLRRESDIERMEQDTWLYADDDDYWDDYLEADYVEADDANSKRSVGERASDFGRSVGDGAHNAASSVKSGARSAADSISAKGRSAADSVRSGSASVRDSAEAARDATAERARRIRDRLARGTEQLTEEAKERVISARWAAVRARRSAARQARKGADKASEFYSENPLVVGGLALAAGALLAGALPRTKQENAYFGASSDSAYDKAERIFESERRKAEKVVDRAAQAAQEVLEEERAKIDNSAPGQKSAAEHVVDEVKSGAKRVQDAAMSEADSQKLGKPNG